ncbi:MAG: ABC transporter substrate-binding protein [Syntrophobacteraceae bacterium]
MKKVHALVFVLILSFLLLTPPTVFCQEALRVGIVLPLTGEKSKFGQMEKKSFEMAQEEINMAGGAQGKRIEFIYEDDKGKTEEARIVAEKLIKENVIMLGGGYGSPETLTIAEVAQKNRIPFLVASGSDNRITEANSEYVFRLNPPASEYPKALESFLSEVVKPQTAAILYENDTFGTIQSKFFQQICDRLKIKIVLMEGYPPDRKDFRSLLLKVKEANPDLLYMMSYLPDASNLVKQSTELKLSPKAFVGGGAGFTLPEFMQNVGKNANTVFSATLWHQSLPYPGARRYYDKFMKRHKVEAAYQGAEAFSSAFVIADALNRAKTMTRDGVRESLLKTDMMTVFGPVKFVSYDKMSNQNKLPTYLVQWIDGKLELVWPKDMASRPFIYPIDWEKVRQ